jgi:hypothetical protein
VYAILPRWPGKSFTVKDWDGALPQSVTLLGSPAPLQFKARRGAVTINLPPLLEDLPGQPCWVLKLSRQMP